MLHVLPELAKPIGQLLYEYLEYGGLTVIGYLIKEEPVSEPELVVDRDQFGVSGQATFPSQKLQTSGGRQHGGHVIHQVDNAEHGD